MHGFKYSHSEVLICQNILFFHESYSYVPFTKTILSQKDLQFLFIAFLERSLRVAENYSFYFNLFIWDLIHSKIVMHTKIQKKS